LERAGGSPAADRAFFMPNRADVYVAALHRWLNNNGGEPFAGESLPERRRTSRLDGSFLQPYPIVSQLLHSSETNPHCPALGMGGVVGCCCSGGVRPRRGMECRWCRRCSPGGTHPSSSFSMGKRVASGRRCSPPQPTGLIKATATAAGWVSLSLQHFLQPSLSLPR
jgi:hypothetical protein